MLIRRKYGWEIPEALATDEDVFLNRRRFMTAGLGLAAGLGLVAGAPGLARAALTYPAPRNPRYVLDRPITDEAVNTSYNNFYEFGSHKRIASAAQKLKLSPWNIRIDGLVEKEMTLGFEDLLARVSLEERLYRHRCVEAWAMAVPWTGFPLSALLDIARPLSGAKFVRFETFKDPSMASGQKQFWYPWPYVEGVTMAEAANDLAFMVTGAYGKPLPKQMGAPLRLALPWKYGFKSIKSITRISFTDKRPVGFWEKIQASEYGFWANVNPEVPHPRWSQATERLLGSDKRVKTKIYNGYGEFVASLYQGMEGEILFR